MGLIIWPGSNAHVFSNEKESDTTASIYTEEELEDRKNDNYLKPDDDEEELGKVFFHVFNFFWLVSLLILISLLDMF